jgi:hypothetical protein
LLAFALQHLPLDVSLAYLVQALNTRWQPAPNRRTEFVASVFPVAQLGLSSMELARGPVCQLYRRNALLAQVLATKDSIWKANVRWAPILSVFFAQFVCRVNTKVLLVQATSIVSALRADRLVALVNTCRVIAVV